MWHRASLRFPRQKRREEGGRREKGFRRREKWKGRKEKGRVRRRKMEGDGGRKEEIAKQILHLELTRGRIKE